MQAFNPIFAWSLKETAADLVAWLQPFVIWLVQAIFQKFKDLSDIWVAWVLSGLSAIIPGFSTSGIQTYLDRINVFFPLSETITLATATLALFLVCFGYRLVKSWIPTVS